MNKEEIEKMFHRIELDKSSDSCGFEFADGFGCTFNNIARCYDDRLELYGLVKHYKYIIDELEKWLRETKLKEFEKVYGKRYGKVYTQAEIIVFNMILNKLQELKGSDKE